ncbi:MAG: YcgN family cysteine cluster protein [Alphaproteobacteria bacterium]|nr:YcgN family cysteine cluster protein [Alphaproteobacteria bacterium]
MNALQNNGELRHKFWEKIPLTDLAKPEWEALCDNCGRCCLLKLEDPDTAEIDFTNIACRLFDGTECHCSQYALRKQLVKDCVVLTPENIERHAYWMPITCAYRLLFEGKPLHDWHPLISGDPDSVHEAGISMRYKTLAEYEINDDDLELYVIEEIS